MFGASSGRHRPKPGLRDRAWNAIYEIDKSVCSIRAVLSDVGPYLREIVQGARAHDNCGHLLS